MSGCALFGGQTTVVNGRHIRCPELVPDALRAGAEVTAAAVENTMTVGGLADFAQQTEAGRLQENRDKLALDQFYRRCDEENRRLNEQPRKRFLGIF